MSNIYGNPNSRECCPDTASQCAPADVEEVAVQTEIMKEEDNVNPLMKLSFIDRCTHPWVVLMCKSLVI